MLPGICIATAFNGVSNAKNAYRAFDTSQNSLL